MKIILNSIYDVEEFVSILSPEYVELVHASSKGCAKLGRQVKQFHVAGTMSAEAATEALTRAGVIVDEAPDPMAAATYGHDLHPEGYDRLVASMDKAVAETSAALRDPDGLPADLTAPMDLGAEPDNSDPCPIVELDATGRPWDEEIDSAAKTKTAKGIWTRSRRRDLTDERYAERAAEVLAKFQAQREWDAPLESEADEPVTTETHALPLENVDEGAVAILQYPYDQLIEAAPAYRKTLEGTEDEIKGDMQPLLVAARDFIGLYGTVAKDALLDAVVGGQSIPSLRDPSDRRLLQACMQNYGSFL